MTSAAGIAMLAHHESNHDFPLATPSALRAFGV